MLTSCGTRRYATTCDEGVVINGVRWATRNVDVSGTFAQNPESAGGFFTWREARNACPRGWRVPTREELQLLVEVDSEWGTLNEVDGLFFGIYPYLLFLPATIWRFMPRGTKPGLPVDVVAFGYYWSSTQYPTRYAWNLRFRFSPMVHVCRRDAAYSVRCVAD